jgi:acyl-CoA thioesterase-1
MEDFYGVNDGRRPSGDYRGEQAQGSDLDGEQQVKNILFFGDSLTAGYGLKSSEAFPSLIQEKINSLGLKYKAINAGVSGETSSGGNYRINSLLSERIDVFVLELGVNDGLRGVPVSETRRNLQSIIDKVRRRHPKAKLVLAGMQLPPYFSQRHVDDFRRMFPDLAEENRMTLIPFLLEGVGGIRSLNLPDGAHPSAAGQKVVANTVWGILKDLLK